MSKFTAVLSALDTERQNDETGMSKQMKKKLQPTKRNSVLFYKL